MKNVKPTLVLLIICIAVSALLAAVNHFTAASAITDPAEIIAKMSPEYEKIFPGEQYSLIYRSEEYGSDRRGIPVEAVRCPSGYIITAHSSGQYDSSPIVAMVGIDNEGKVVKVSILSMNETPGMGSKINSDKFLSQFELGSGFSTDGGKGTKIDVVSGATKSSTAFMKAVNIALEEFRVITGGAQR